MMTDDPTRPEASVTEEDLFRKTFLRLLELHLELEAVVAAMGLALQDQDKTFEGRVGEQRAKLLMRNEKVLAAFHASKTAEWLAMLDQLKGPPH